MSYALGSHLVTSRFGYTHHGIYAGNDLVIHYLRDEGVSLTSLEDFSCGNAVWVRTHHGACYSGEECVERAWSRLYEDNYNLIFNNCEHFATWCATGEAQSEQVERVVQTSGVVLTGAALARGIGSGLAAGSATTAGIVGLTASATSATTAGVVGLGMAAVATPAAVTVGLVVGAYACLRSLFGSD